MEAHQIFGMLCAVITAGFTLGYWSEKYYPTCKKERNPHKNSYIDDGRQLGKLKPIILEDDFDVRKIHSISWNVHTREIEDIEFTDVVS